MLLLCQNQIKPLPPPPPPLERLLTTLLLSLAVFERLRRRCGLRVLWKQSRQWSHREGPRTSDWNLSLSFTSEMHSWYDFIVIMFCCCNHHCWLYSITTVKPLITDSPSSGQPQNNGQMPCPRLILPYK